MSKTNRITHAKILLIKNFYYLWTRKELSYLMMLTFLRMLIIYMLSFIVWDASKTSNIKFSDNQKFFAIWKFLLMHNFYSIFIWHLHMIIEFCLWSILSNLINFWLIIFKESRLNLLFSFRERFVNMNKFVSHFVNNVTRKFDTLKDALKISVFVIQLNVIQCNCLWK